MVPLTMVYLRPLEAKTLIVQRTVASKTVTEYRTLLHQPVPAGWPSRAEWIDHELGRYRREGNFAHPVVIPPAEIPRFVALRAIELQIGSSWPHLKPERQAFARYPESARRRWSPLARRLWLEASYDWKTSDLATVRTDMATLRRLDQNLDALEAHLIGRGRKPSNGYANATDMLRYAETHPNDIVAAKRSTVALYVPTFLAVERRQPVRKDLLDRVFALEARTIRNQNALLNDDVRSLKTFDILRDTMNGKYVEKP